jgi:phage/plasmid primase-like uncharacterized protein
LHWLVDAPWRPGRPVVRHVPLAADGQQVSWGLLARQFQTDADPGRLDQLAAGLGLSVTSLCQLGLGWSAQHRAWSFPMTDANGNVLGIRLRRTDGRKFSVKGGREGLFVPEGATEDKSPLLICEGPTDAAALLDMGFRGVVGRPNCTGGIKLLAELVRRRQPPEVVIVSDGDEPGQVGAGTLALVLVAYAPAVRVIAPPEGIKDAREWRKAGGTKADVEKVIGAAQVRRLAIRSKIVGVKG